MQEELQERCWEDDYYIFINSTLERFRSLVDSGANLETLDKEFLKPFLEKCLTRFKNREIPEETLLNAKMARVKMNDVEITIEHVLREFEKVELKIIKQWII